MVLANDLPNCALQINTMDNNRLSTNLCFENIESTALKKSDSQKTFGILVEKSRANNNEYNCDKDSCNENNCDRDNCDGDNCDEDNCMFNVLIF